MRNERTIDTITKDGLCTGCGTCLAICPTDAVGMVIDELRGVYVPKLDREKCTECGICLEACPGYSVDFRQLNTEIFGKQPDDMVTGNYLNCYTGHATNYDIRYNSASGGVITALLVFALEQEIIDGVLVTRMNENSPLEPEPFVAKTRAEIISAAKSKYCPVPANVALRHLLKHDGKYAVVGLPCHLHGIRKAEASNKQLRERLVLHMGIFCSHTDSFRMTEFLLRKHGVNKEDVSHLDYRGEGWPGSMTIHFKGGTKKTIPLDDYVVFHALSFFTPRRCRLCYDRDAELADISCGDAWLPEIVIRDKVGTSIVIPRTEAGRALCAQAEGKGHVELEARGEEAVRQWSASKKRRMKANSNLTYFFRSPQPNYGTKLLRPGFADYLWSVLFYFNGWFSYRSCLHRFIDPLVHVEQWAKRWLSKVLRLVS